MSIISTDQLTKTFGEVTAVDHVSFAVERGEIFAFLGPNGAGKSTTIKMLTTLLTPTSGRIEVAGHDPGRVRRPSPHVRHHLSGPEPRQRADRVGTWSCTGSSITCAREAAKPNPRAPTFLELWDRRNSLVKRNSREE